MPPEESGHSNRTIEAMTQTQVRQATARDVGEIVSIWGELAAHHTRLDEAFRPSRHWQEEYQRFIRDLLGREDAHAVVAVEGGRVIGYGVGRISMLPAFFERRRRGYLHDVVVREPYRRRGVGRSLVETLLAWMQECDAPTVELTVAVLNEEAVAFWTRLGFAQYMYHFKRELR